MPKAPDPKYWDEMHRKIIGLGDKSLRKSYFPELRKRLGEIEEKELLYHAIFDQAYQLITTLDLNGRVLQVNTTALQLIGAREVDIVGRPFPQTPWWEHSPLEQAKVRQAIAEAADGGTVRFETCHRDARGGEHAIDFSLKPALDQAGKVVFLIAEGRDVTSYERTSRELLQLKNLYLALSRVNSAILINRRAKDLMQDICEIAAVINEVRLAWFGFVDPAGGVVRPLVWAGEAIAAVHEFHIDTGEQEPDAPCGFQSQRAGQSGQPLVIDDLQQDPEALPWKSLLEDYGLRSLGAYPVQCLEGTSGLLVLYSDVPGLFRGSVNELFMEMAANVAYALDNLEREKLRTQAEQALRESEARFRELVENANTIILRLSPQGEVTYFNDFAERFFGWNSGEVVGRPVWETILPGADSKGEDLSELFSGVCSRPEIYRYHVNQNVCKDGRRVWVAWTNKVFSDADGTISEILSIGVDITGQREQAAMLERKVGEEEVRTKLLRLSVEEMPLQTYLQRALCELTAAPWLGLLPIGAIFLADPSGQELRLLAAHNLSEGKTRACAKVPFGTCLCGQVAQQKRPLFRHHCNLRQADDVAVSGHAHHILPLLSGDDLLGVLSLYLPEESRCDKEQETFLVTVADLLASVIVRKEAQVALREHDTLLQQLIDSIPLPIFHKDADLVYQGCNDAFAREVIGLAKQEIIGKTAADLAPSDLASVYADADLQLLKEGGGQVYETEVVFADGNRHPVIFHKAVLHKPDGTPRGIVGALLDLMEHKQLEEQLRHAQKVEALGTLTGGIAHDFNNLLTAIMGYASILQLKMPPHELYTDMVRQILATTERAANLTHSLLTYSRKKVAHPQVIELNQVVGDVKSLARRLIRESIDLDFDLCADSLPVLADATQFEQVLINLVTNARDAMLQGGHLIVSTRRVTVDKVLQRRHAQILPGDYAMIVVTDSGSGIPDELLERIFDPFFTTKEVGRGTGLGLSICYSIVKQHQGFIDVDTGVERGTTFRIYLPIAEMSETADPASEVAAGVPGGEETLLLVEDDPSVRISSRLLLEEFGYRVIDTGDGAEALEVLGRRAGEINLILSDVVMPRMSGMELRTRVLQRWPKLPMLFTSGYTFDTLEEHGAGDVEVIEKPAKPAELLLRIRELLDRVPPD